MTVDQSYVRVRTKVISRLHVGSLGMRTGSGRQDICLLREPLVS